MEELYRYGIKRRSGSYSYGIGDETLYENQSYYSDKPRITLTTNTDIAKKRAEERDLKHKEIAVNNDELYHYGIKGKSGRYPYGSGERPYQDKERARGFREKMRVRKSKKQADKIRKQKEEETARRIKERDYQRFLEENKSRMLMSGGPKDIAQYKGRLTNQEYEQIFKRLDYEAKLAALTPSEFDRQMKRMDYVMKNLKTAQQWMDIGTDLWNSTARIYNATDKGKKNPLTLVQKGQPPQNKDKHKN